MSASAHATLTYYDPESTTGRLVFRGIDGLECEEFIYMIRLRATTAGKARDKEWMADLAGMAFVGGALRWYDSLSEEVQGDWLLLRRALLGKYPAPEAHSGSSTSDMAPAPASAASLTPAAAPPSAAGSPSNVGNQIRQRGRIKIAVPGYVRLGGYISSELTSSGRYKTTASASEALTVGVVPGSGSRSQLKLMTSSDRFFKPYEWLGLDWHEAAPLDPVDSAAFSYLSAVGRTGNASMTSSSGAEGEKWTEVWSIAPDGMLMALHGEHVMDVAVDVNDRHINFYCDFAAHKRAKGASLWDQARLVFEPVS